MELSIEAIRSGDNQAFAALYDTYYRRIVFYCMQFGFSQVDAEDIVQDVFVKIYRSRLKYESLDHIKNTLYLGVKRAIVSKNRLFKTEKAFLKEYTHLFDGIYADDFEKAAYYKQLLAEVLAAIDELTPDRREALIMAEKRRNKVRSQAVPFFPLR